MSETEKRDVQVAAEIYKKLPPYLQGKLDGYAEALKENREAAKEEAKADDSEA